MAALQKHEPKLDPQYDDYDFPTVAPDAKNGHSGYTTAAQDAQVSQLRLMLEAEGYKERLDTLTLLRFLRARKFVVADSKKMFIDCEKWRKTFAGQGLDHLVQNFDYKEKAKVFQYYPQYYHKTDKDGRPIYIEQLGKIDLAALAKITSDERMLQNLAVEYEKLADPRLPACSRKSGYLLETCCTIMDAKGVGLTSIPSVYGFVSQASGMSQNYYPERLGQMHIINAPWGFSGAFSVIKKFLDPITVAKIHIHGSGYQKELLKQIPAENLPKQFGGSCDCAGGCQFSDVGPWTDPQFAKPPKWQTAASKASGPPQTEGENNPAALEATQASLSASSGVPHTT